eukprot:7624405-Pyramimonas_sp.AAC.1
MACGIQGCPILIESCFLLDARVAEIDVDMMTISELRQSGRASPFAAPTLCIRIGDVRAMLGRAGAVWK